MLIEKDKRDIKIPLLYGDQKFSIPKNVYIIGTMNTYDENLQITDYAVRRRFCFYTIKPAYDNTEFKKFCHQNPALEKVVNGIVEVNKNLDDRIKIGHSYFCKPMNNDELSMTVKYNLIPYVKQCYRNDLVTENKMVGILEESIKDISQ